MAGCDDHLVFSNHSSREKMVKLYTDDMVLDKVHAWLHNTGMVSNSEIPDNFVQRAFPSSAQLVQAQQWKIMGGSVLKCGRRDFGDDSTVPPKRRRRDTPCEGRGNLSGVPSFDQVMYDEQRARSESAASVEIFV